MNHFSQVLDLVDSVANRFHRKPGSVRVLAASKQVTAEDVNEFISEVNDRGCRALIGESFLQEMLAKVPQLRGDYELHFIGRIQSNKVPKLVQACDVIQSVAREKILALISREGLKLERGPQRIFIQVNVSSDPRKDGFFMEQVPGLVARMSEYPGVALEGLMTITENYDDAALVRADYNALNGLVRSLGLSEVSMGMSSDYELAIEEGSTIVRLGSCLFGERRG